MIRPAFLIAFFTIIIRYYDYALFGLSAATLSKNFFPPDTSHNQILLFYAIFGIAVIARPLGSIIFGFIGDKYGRATSVKISVFLATTSTILIGLVPNFGTIGIFSTLILTFCRMLFFISLAGESDGIKIYVVEKVGKLYKNYANGIVVCCSQVGALLAALMYYLATEHTSITYLWRINFIIGGIFGVFIIFMRHYFVESEEFLQYQNNPHSPEIKFLDLKKILKEVIEKFILALVISGAIGGIYHFLIIFWGVFSVKFALIHDFQQGQRLNILLIVIYAVMSIVSGKLADKFSPKLQIITSLLLSLLIIVIAQFVLYINNYLIYFPIFLIVLAPFYMIPLQIIVQSIFHTNIRNRMYSLSHSIGGMVLSSTTPFFCMVLWQYSHSLHIVLGFLLLLLALLLTTVIYLYTSTTMLLFR
ncbi:MFS transporter [Candidatus Tisiphia endosymbiont of Beris chalybata]|uniref:MFS transporter n=1 Tax=Candidatus Tisiphia endosymbiont of Beris chalybata TaxID=3066262 RepID=UPI00312C9ACD